MPPGIATKGEPHSTLAPDPEAIRQRGDAIIGHRLGNGDLAFHAPRQQCALCDGAGPAIAVQREKLSITRLIRRAIVAHVLRS